MAMVGRVRSGDIVSNLPAHRPTLFSGPIAVKDTIFLTPISTFLQGSWDMCPVPMINPYPRLAFGDGALKWRWMVRVSRKFWRSHGESAIAPYDHLIGP